MFVPRVLVTILLSVESFGLMTDERRAAEWLDDYNNRAESIFYDYVLKHWIYNTNLTQYNQHMALEGSVSRANFRREAYQNTTLFDWRHFTDPDLKRQFSKVADIGTSVLKGHDLTQVNMLNSDMEMIYSTAEVCKPDNESHCLTLDPDLTDIMATSHDWDELVWAWDGWRKASGARIKDKYVQFVALQNKAARMNNFADAGQYWKSWYEDPQFEAECLRLWTEVKPLYQQLHAYVKRKLQQLYKHHQFPVSGHIPAHILGNMWGQQWTTLLKAVVPYPAYPSIDVTKSLLEQNYTAHRMFVVAEDFFTSLGLPPMPDAFWRHSMIEKPQDGRQVVCHASAWDFYNGKDFRIKQCTDMTQDYLITTHHEMGHVQYFLLYKHQPIEYRDGANPGCMRTGRHTDFSTWPCIDKTFLFWLIRIKQCTEIDHKWLLTVHHEMGHVQYYLQYKHLPVLYRRGANPGFHEAVGDIMSLSVATPEHLSSIGLLQEISTDKEYDINFLMGQALQKIAFLPFGFLIDQWRWSVFRGETKPEEYNRKWWELRCKHQGVSPPVPRLETDFDPGAKFHIPSNTPYIRYFVSFIIQFQFHKSLCEASGYNGPLHRCDIYNCTTAGKKLREMLALGSSKPWPEAMKAITGQSRMDNGPLMEYFKPLADWLEEQNAGYDVTWRDDCPPGSFASKASDRSRIQATAWSMYMFMIVHHLNIFI